MIERYSRKEMTEKWTQQAKYKAWLDVEIAVVKGWNRLGLIPNKDLKNIVQNAKFDIKRIEEIEKETKHDVIAFLTSVSESLGSESRWIHYGMTSSDAIDTGVALQIKESLTIIINDVEMVLNTLEKRAFQDKKTLMVGRSHGIHGEPITFGLVIAIWYEEMKRHLDNLKSSLDVISVGQVSGAMGNFAHSPIELEELVCKELNLKPAPVSNQVIQRDRYARVISAIGLMVSTVEKIAVAIRHFQRTEVYEVEEFFAKGQKGSSAMPHKRNPILSENITGLARTIRAFVTPAMENVALWHERDISHSSVERFMLPDVFITTDFMLHRLNGLLDKMVVYPKNMMKNLNLTGGLVFSQRVLLELPLLGLSREESYKIVQRNAMKVWNDLQNGKSALNDKGESLYLQHLLNDSELQNRLSETKIRDLFNYEHYTKNVDAIFSRVFKEIHN
jgi:adenylosuccinate lyase